MLVTRRGALAEIEQDGPVAERVVDDDHRADGRARGPSTTVPPAFDATAAARPADETSQAGSYGLVQAKHALGVAAGEARPAPPMLSLRQSSSWPSESR